MNTIITSNAEGLFSKVLKVGAAIGAIILGLTAGAQAQSTLEKARNEGVIRIGFANEAPYGYATPSGELTGEAPAVAKEIFSRLGIENVEGVLTEFGSLIPGLRAGRFDVIAAGMFIPPERCAQIQFSEPSYGIGQAMLGKPGTKWWSPMLKPGTLLTGLGMSSAPSGNSIIRSRIGVSSASEKRLRSSSSPCGCTTSLRPVAAAAA